MRIDPSPVTWKTFRPLEAAVLLCYGAVVLLLAFTLSWRGFIASLPAPGRHVPAERTEDDCHDLDPPRIPPSPETLS